VASATILSSVTFATIKSAGFARPADKIQDLLSHLNLLVKLRVGKFQLGKVPLRTFQLSQFQSRKLWLNKQLIKRL